VLLVRPREPSEASDGLLDSFPLGLGGGLRDRLRGEDRRVEESSDADVKCLELTVGTGGNASVGDCVERPYRDVFRRTILGGEPLPVGVETGDAR